MNRVDNYYMFIVDYLDGIKLLVTLLNRILAAFHCLVSSWQVANQNSLFQVLNIICKIPISNLCAKHSKILANLS